MARHRPPEYCHHCGKQLESIYLNQDNVPMMQRVIGDTFRGYKRCECFSQPPTSQPEGVSAEGMKDKIKSILENNLRYVAQGVDGIVSFGAIESLYELYQQYASSLLTQRDDTIRELKLEIKRLNEDNKRDPWDDLGKNLEETTF